MENEVTKETKMVLIQQERQMWLNTQEVMTMRYRVQKRINNEEGVKACEKELTNCENALDELDKIFTEIQKAE